MIDDKQIDELEAEESMFVQTGVTRSTPPARRRRVRRVRRRI